MHTPLQVTGLTSLLALSTLLSTSAALPSPYESRVREYDAKLLVELGAPVKRDAAVNEQDKPIRHLPLSHQFHHRHLEHGSSPRSLEADFTPDLTTSTSTPLEERASVVSPSPVSFLILGASLQAPAMKYFWPQKAAPLPTLAASILVPVIDNALTTGYSMWNGTGTITLTGANLNTLYPLSTVPSISRDSGKGGYLNGSKLFIFSDTETFTAPTAAKVGQFTGFQSNSVALDWGFNAANGEAVAIRDHCGSWANNLGAQRQFVPFTLGEKSYNNAMNGHGARLAIWPESSITPLTATTALQYAPIVFINTTSGTQFTYMGMTMYTISIPNVRSGPVANRIAPMLFPKGQMEWGSMGGVRSWGASGYGGDDGWVYIFANNAAGLFAGRVTVDDIAVESAYEYWNATKATWQTTMPPGSCTDATIGGSYSSSDIFYSPRHKTFINVYADRYIDNRFLWRYLEAPTALVPAYDGTDFVSNILKYPWSGEKTLFHTGTPGNGQYVYAQGVHMGYFEDDDIVNGGTKMLLAWTAPNGYPSDSIHTGYDFTTAVVDWA